MCISLLQNKLIGCISDELIKKWRSVRKTGPYFLREGKSKKKLKSADGQILKAINNIGFMGLFIVF